MLLALPVSVLPMAVMALAGKADSLGSWCRSKWHLQFSECFLGLFVGMFAPFSIAKGVAYDTSGKVGTQFKITLPSGRLFDGNTT